MEMYELSPRDGRKSFYSKAMVAIDPEGNETLYSYGTEIGERVFRGLFKSSKGFINADLNGALNIIKKVYKDFCCETANLSIDFFRTIVKVSPKFTVSR